MSYKIIMLAQEGISALDRECFEAVLSVPWLRDSVIPTGSKWGKHIADVRVSGVPNFLLCQPLMIPSDPKDVDSPLLTDELRLVIYRCDRDNHQGWEESFVADMEFPDGSGCQVEVPPSCKLLDCHSLIVPCSSLRERRYQQEDTRKIPRIIFSLSSHIPKQKFQEVRRIIKNVRKITSLLQCNALYVVLEDEACRREVQAADTQIENFLTAYNALRLATYKADLIRYYLLYKYGGICCDDGTLISQSIDSRSFDRIFAGCDFFATATYFNSPKISFLGAKKGSPIMLAVLQQAIHTIMRRSYTDHRLGITGDHIFAQVMMKEVPLQVVEENSEIKWVHRFSSEGEKETCALLTLNFANDSFHLNEEVLWQQRLDNDINNNSQAWSRGEVFVDGNPSQSRIKLFITSDAMKIMLQIGMALLVLSSIAFLISQYPSINWL